MACSHFYGLFIPSSRVLSPEREFVEPSLLQANLVYKQMYVNLHTALPVLIGSHLYFKDNMPLRVVEVDQCTLNKVPPKQFYQAQSQFHRHLCIVPWESFSPSVTAKYAFSRSDLQLSTFSSPFSRVFP